jgi:hypothetical protein
MDELLTLLLKAPDAAPLAVVAGVAWLIVEARRSRAAILVHEIRNCVHHGLMFDRLGVTRDEISHAEHDAGVGPKGG